MKLKYHGFVMPNKWTFGIPYIKNYLEMLCADKRILLPYAGMTRLRTPSASLYIDIDPDVKPDIVSDCKDILPKLLRNKDVNYDIVLLDPPFSAHQAIRKYGNKKMSDLSVIKDYCAEILSEGGVVVTFGFNSTGMGKKRGFIKDELHIFNHGGNHNDMFMLKEHKKNSLEGYL